MQQLRKEVHMRMHSNSILIAALVVIALCFLLGVACSWDIVTSGEVTSDEIPGQLVSDVPEGLVISPDTVIVPGSLDLDSLAFKVFSIISIDSVRYDFVEMEVGELLYGIEGERDTLYVDHRP